jgi:nucleoside-diphosphate-sugar epimerase
LIEITAAAANKIVNIEYIDGPTGVRGRNSDNRLIREKLNWDYEQSLENGIAKTYDWINSQI